MLGHTLCAGKWILSIWDYFNHIDRSSSLHLHTLYSKYTESFWNRITACSGCLQTSGGLTMLSVTSVKSDKRPFFNMKKWNSGKTALKCEEWRLKVVKSGQKWRLSAKLATLSVTSAKSNIHGSPPPHKSVSKVDTHFTKQFANRVELLMKSAPWLGCEISKLNFWQPNILSHQFIMLVGTVKHAITYLIRFYTLRLCSVSYITSHL